MTTGGRIDCSEDEYLVGSIGDDGADENFSITTPEFRLLCNIVDCSFCDGKGDSTVGFGDTSVWDGALVDGSFIEAVVS